MTMLRHAFNERIAELEGERHTGRAMEVLKQNDFGFGAADRRTSQRISSVSNEN